MGPSLHQFPCRYLLLYTASCTVLLVSDIYTAVTTFETCFSIIFLDGSNWFLLIFLSAATGITFIQFTNHNSMRNIYILGVSLFLGISIPQYFVMNTDVSGHGPVRTGAGWVLTYYSLSLSLSRARAGACTHNVRVKRMKRTRKSPTFNELKELHFFRI